MECQKVNHRKLKPLSTECDTGGDKRLSRGCSNLMYACQQGLTDNIVKELRKKPNTVHYRDRSNKSALHYCSGQRDLIAAASVAMAAPELMESADEDGFTPLHLAVIQGNMSLVSLLLANKGDVNSLDNEGHSVVHWATVCGESEALRAVLNAGADVSMPDINGGTPLHYAAQMCGANYDGKSNQASSKLAIEILNILINHPGSNVDIVDKDGRPPLLWAASAGSAKAVLALIKAGARVESSDKDGLTAIHCAASRGHTECIDALINLCGAPTDLIDSNGCSALHYAVTLGHADATRLLLDLEADPNRQDRKGRTPAHCGCAKGQLETVKILESKTAHMWLRNAKGDLPIHEAAVSGRRELVEWLLELRPNQVNTTSNDGRTLLHIAAGNDNTDMCKILIDYGADVNSICRTPRNIVLTPLDCALQKGFRGTAKFLQVHGGLPAGKLRLSARRQTGLNDTDLVKPLKFKEKEQNYESKKSKRYVVYVKRSDSELSEREIYNQNQQTGRSRRVKSRCRHHRKKRTSSCSDSFIFTKDDCCNEMNRSKSNIEIRRRMKSKHKHDSYSTDDSSSDEYCNNRRKYRCNKKCCTSSKCNKSKDKDDSNGPDGQESEDKIHKKKRSRRREKRKTGGSNENSSLPSEKSDNEPEDKKKTSNKDEETLISNDISSLKLETEKEKSLSSSTSKEDTNLDVKIDRPSSSKKRPQSAKASSAQKRKTQQTIDEVEKNITDENNQQLDLSDEVDEAPSKLITKAQVHAIDESSAHSEVVTVPTGNDLEKKVDSEVSEHITTKEIEETKKIEEVSKQETSEENKTEEALKKVTFGTVEQKTCQEITTTPIIDHEVECSNKVTEKEEIKKNEQSFAVIAQQESSVSSPSQPAPPPTPTQTLTQLPPKKPHQHPPQSPAPLSAQNVSKSPSSFKVIGVDDDTNKSSDELVIDDQPQSFQILEKNIKKSAVTRIESEQDEDDEVEEFRPSDNKKSESASSSDKHGRRKKLKKRSKNIKNYDEKSDDDKKITQQHSKDQDSGFEPSPRAMRTKIPSPKSAHTAVFPRKPAFTMLDDRLCKIEGRKPGDQNAVNMTTVTQSIQKNIRRYYMERKIFQHLLELKSLQIRSSKVNETVLVKRAVDDYHKSIFDIDVATGGGLKRFPYSDYTFKNFEIFLYETLKGLQKSGTFNFQNISDVYKEAERRLSPDYNKYEKALLCTTKTHRCLHAAHAYTGIPCAAYIPMMNHHTMPKYGFGQYKTTGVGSFYLPKILTKNQKTGNRVSLELSHGNNKQLIPLPYEKLDSNKKYYVTFSVKGNENNTKINDENSSKSDSEKKKI